MCIRGLRPWRPRGGKVLSTDDNLPVFIDHRGAAAGSPAGGATRGHQAAWVAEPLHAMAAGREGRYEEEWPVACMIADQSLC